MADNLDFRGTVEISVDKAVSDLDRLVDQIHKAQDAFKESGGMKTFEDTLESVEQRLESFKKHVDAFKNINVDQFATFEEAFKRGLIDDADIKKAVAEVINLRTELSKSHDEALRLNESFNKRMQDEQRKGLAEQAKLQQQAYNEAMRLDEEELERVQRHAQLRAKVELDAQREGIAEQKRLQEQAAREAAQRDEDELDRYFRQQDLRERVANQAVKEQEQRYAKLANTRYALYDVANTFTVISAATLGAAGAAIKFSADYDQAFKSVERTSLTAGQAAEDLKEELITLTTQIPKSFDEVANIATLGAQMDIPTEHLTKFTETVAMFASTTDTSVDKAAMSLGRLAQLTKTSVNDIDRLASSIYFVGINSVATEEQILTISEQIAASGNLAGFAAEEIIGLSAAMASLGVQPERARGAVMRIFNSIRTAVDEGNESLYAFAETANMSAEDFSDAWLNRPAEAFSRLLGGLNRVGEAGESVGLKLRELGIIAARDLDVMERLADNTDVHAAAMADAALAYEENTALADGYNTQIDNLNDAMTLLMNSIKGLAAELGEIPGLKEFVLLMGQAVERVRQFINNPIGKAFAMFVVGITGVIGAVAAWIAIQARLTASAYGLMTAMDGITEAGGVQMLGWRALKKALGELIQYTKVYKADNQQLATSLDRVTVSGKKAAGSLTQAGSAAKATETGIKGATTAFRTFARATVVLAAISAAIWAIDKAVNTFSESMKSNTQRVEDFIGSTTSLRDAMIADGESIDENAVVLATWTRRVEDSGDAAEVAAASLGIARDGQLELKQATEDTTGAIEEQILAFGEQSKQVIVDAFSEGLKEADFTEWQQNFFSGFDVEGFGKLLFDDIANGTDNANKMLVDYQSNLNLLATTYDLIQDAVGQDYEVAAAQWGIIKDNIAAISPELLNTLSPSMKEFLGQIKNLDETALASGELNTQILENGKRLFDGASALRRVGEQLPQIFSVGGKALNEYAREVSINEQKSSDFAAGLGLLGDEGDETGDKFEDLAQKIQDFGNFLAASGANMESALEGLGASIYENGLVFDTLTEEGRANIGALEAAVNAMAVNAAGDVDVFMDNIYSMLGALEAQGVNTADTLDFVYVKLLELVGPSYGVDVSTAAARQNLINLLQDGQAAQALLAELGAINSRLSSARSWGAAMAIHDEVGARKNEIENQLKLIDDITKRVSSARDVAVSTGSDVSRAIGRGVTNAYNKANEAAKKAGGSGKKAGKDMAKAAKDAQKEIRTLADYVSDLSSVMSRAIEFRFGVTQSKDATTDIWAGIKQRAEDAREAINKALQDILDANAKLLGLRSDVQILEYQLTVAEEYNDTLRATQIRAELAEKNAEITKTEKDKTDAQKAAKKAQEDSSKSLKGNSDAARKNRSDIISLVNSYQKQIEALADSGLTTKQLQRETERLRQDFVKQATQLGFNRSEVETYAKAFDDLSTIIKNVPRNITVNANVNPAKKAIDEFIARKEKTKSLPTSASNPTKSNMNSVKNAIQKGIKPSLTPSITGAENEGKKAGKAAAKGFKNAFGTIKTRTTGAYGEYSVYRKGGFTGRGNPNEEAGIVHRGEYVVPAPYVNQSTGLPDLNALGKSLGMNTYAGSVSSAPSSPGVVMVELSARDRQLLAEAGNKALILDGRVIATAVNDHNRNNARRGAY